MTKAYKVLRIYSEAYPLLERMAKKDKRSLASMMTWLIQQEDVRRRRRKQREQKGQGGADES